MAVTPKEAKEKHDKLESDRLVKLMNEFKQLEPGIDQHLIDSAGQGAKLKQIGAQYLEAARATYSPAWKVTVFEYETGDQQKTWIHKGLEFKPNPDARIPGTLNYVEPQGGK